MTQSTERVRTRLTRERSATTILLRLSLPRLCRGCGAGSCCKNTDQEIIFSCVVITQHIAATTSRRGSTLSSPPRLVVRWQRWVWSWLRRVGRSLVRCRSPEPAGYCHGALNDTTVLANHDVCVDGATTDIGFHIRITFKVNVQEILLSGSTPTMAWEVSSASMVPVHSGNMGTHECWQCLSDGW